MIPRKTCHSLAPSTRAASSSSVLMPLRPADRMTIAKPVHIQMPMKISAKLLSRLAPASSAIGPSPTSPMSALSVPICGRLGSLVLVHELPDDPGGHEADRQRQEDRRLGDGLVAHAVDEDRDEQPEPDDAGGHEHDPEHAVPQRLERARGRGRTTGSCRARRTVLRLRRPWNDSTMRVDRRVDQEHDQEGERRGDPEPRPDAALAPLRKGLDEPLGEQDVADQDRRDADHDDQRR